ncbi:hypothetical protein [Shinella sp.]|uniref:hypothetical protein n=1 Tax=Shinella sp. TaxID=1870904 RepID=UPI0039E566D5
MKGTIPIVDARRLGCSERSFRQPADVGESAGKCRRARYRPIGAIAYPALGKDDFERSKHCHRYILKNTTIHRSGDLPGLVNRKKFARTDMIEITALQGSMA